jgi:AcrR family transcriptional regulator
MRSKSSSDTFTERARRAQIVQCAIELIGERGYAAASVARIAERAGVAKSVVLYYFRGKDELVGAIVTEIFTAAAATMLPAIDAEKTAAGKLAAYIRSNADYLQTHRGYAMALLEIWTSFRTSDGLRLDEAAAQSKPDGDLARLDPESIFRLGQKRREFRAFDPQAMAIALRQAIDGAVLHSSRDPHFDIDAYCEELVTIFDLATRRSH